MEDRSAREGFRYRAFIAYSHRDEKWARWLHAALEAYAVPTRLVGSVTSAGAVPRRLSPVFRDRAELASGPDLDRLVNEALTRSANLIVICSPDAAASRYVDTEVRMFQALGRADRIFCCIVAGEPNASRMSGREGEECFPPALRVPDRNDPAAPPSLMEPIAADARPGKDGKANAKLKLIAGMLDIGFDALKQREHQRRVRRMALVTAASVTAMVIMTGLAIDAALARRAAVADRQAAERHQKQAEDLVEFMLGDLNDKLSEVHRLDILEATDNQAMKYFQSLPSADESDAVLALRVKALQIIGGIRADQGALPAALESLEAAGRLAGELAQRSPQNRAFRIAYGHSLNWIGSIYWFQGDRDRSLDYFQRAITILQDASATAPDDANLAADLSSARTNAGRVFESRGEFARAEALYQSVEQALEELRRREPTNPDWQSSLGDAYDNLGKLALERGDLARAVGAYRDDQRIKADLAAVDRKNYDAQDRLVVSDAILGRTLALCGDTETGTHYAREAVDIAHRLVEFDATQTVWQEDLGYYEHLLGGLLREARKFDAAARLDSDAIRVLSSLAATDATNAGWRRELAMAQLESARLALDRHDGKSADRALAGARATIDALAANTPRDPALVQLSAEASLVAGKLAERHGDGRHARESWRRVLEELGPLKQLNGDPNVLADWASASVLLGDLATARPVLDRLAAIGYRTPDFANLLADHGVAYPSAATTKRIVEGSGTAQASATIAGSAARRPAR